MTANFDGLPILTEAQRDALHDALTRYYVALGVAGVDIEGELLYPLELTARDRETHSISPGDYADEEKIIEFMHAVSGLPRSLCATWNYHDNVDMTRQGAQPEWGLAECYASTLALVTLEAAAA